MKKILFVSTALLTFLTACDDDYNDQFNIGSSITDVKNVNLVLQDADYGTIAGLPANKELALSKDPEGGTVSAALAQLGSQKYFTNLIPAEEYLPAYLASIYPMVDDGSKIAVTANVYKEPSGYLADFKNISTYQLTEDDYASVWGEKVKANFLSPSSVSKISTILKTVKADAADGDMVVVNYAYSQVEPSIGGGSTAEPTWTQIATIPARATGNDWNFTNMGPIDLSEYKDQTVNLGFKYTSTTSDAATWELKNFKVLSVPYLDVAIFAKQDDGSFKKLVKSSEFKGAGEYVIAARGADAQFYPFGRLAEGKTYGYMYPDAIAISNGVISAADAADFVITLTATDAGFTMKNAIGQYLYQSGNYDSFNVSETTGDKGYDWTVSSAGGADLFTVSNVETGKSIKLNYYKTSYSFGCYAASKLEGYTYVNSDDNFAEVAVDLGGLSNVWSYDSKYNYWKATAYVNNVRYATESFLVSPAIEIAEDAALPYATIDEAFRYDGAEALTVWVSTDYASSVARSRAMSRADVAANASVLYVCDEGEWSIYSNDDATVNVVDPSVYASLGSSTISTPETVIPAYLSLTYPYAADGDRVAVVYNKSVDKPVVEEYTFNGTWSATKDCEPTTINFTRENGVFVAQMSSYIDETFLGSEGGFTVQNVSLGGLNYVWQNSTSYGWKASAYYNSKNNPAESWLVSPAVDFKKATAPEMVFDEAHRYLNGAAPESYFGVKVSTDYKGDVTTCTWEDLKVEGWSDGSTWDFVTINVIDLSKYIGQTVYFAFWYKSDENAAPTWEVKNLKVREHVSEPAE